MLGSRLQPQTILQMSDQLGAWVSHPSFMSNAHRCKSVEGHPANRVPTVEHLPDGLASSWPCEAAGLRRSRYDFASLRAPCNATSQERPWASYLLVLMRMGSFNEIPLIRAALPPESTELPYLDSPVDSTA